jgi:hypothetical protein
MLSRTELASLHMHIAVSLRILTSTIHCEVSSIGENAFPVGEVDAYGSFFCYQL